MCQTLKTDIEGIKYTLLVVMKSSAMASLVHHDILNARDRFEMFWVNYKCYKISFGEELNKEYWIAEFF